MYCACGSCVYFFTRPNKSVLHADINTYSSVNLNLRTTIVTLGSKMLNKAKEITVKWLESKDTFGQDSPHKITFDIRFSLMDSHS